MFEDLLANGAVRPVGVYTRNSYPYSIYAHDESGDLIVYVEDEDTGYLIDGLCAADSMVDVSDTTDLMCEIAKVPDGVGAIKLTNNRYIIISGEEDSLTCTYSDTGVSVQADIISEVDFDDYI